MQRGISVIANVVSDQTWAVGDASKTAAVIAAGMIQGGHEALGSGESRTELVAGMRTAAECALEILGELACHAKSRDDVFHVGLTASGDEMIAELVVEAMRKGGKNGKIRVEMGHTTKLEMRDGLTLDSGFVSEEFITDPNTQRCELSDCLVLAYDGGVDSMRSILPIAEASADKGKPLAILCTGIDREALSTLIVNKMRNVLQSAVVRLPRDQQSRELMEDVAAYTGGKVVSELKGDVLENVVLADLGSADRISVTRNETLIVGGANDPGVLERRLKQIKGQMNENPGLEELDRLAARLAGLDGQTAVLTVGGITDDEKIDMQYRAVSAVHSSRAVVEEGYVAGGGVACRTIAQRLREKVKAQTSGIRGWEILASALELPEQRLLATSNNEKLVPAKELDQGVNLATGETCNMIDAGILDTAKGIRCAIETGAVALLSTVDWDDV